MISADPAEKTRGNHAQIARERPEGNRRRESHSEFDFSRFVAFRRWPSSRATLRSEKRGFYVGINTWNAEFDDLVRYKYEISGSEGGWILFRMLPPVWFDEVVA